MATAFLSGLEQRLKSAKPGLPAQLKMVPSPRPGQKTYLDVGDDCLKAGVMLLLYPDAESWRLVFIRRTSTVLHHKDQIGFPGGQIEPGEDRIRAALRETWEELGVAPENIRIIGELTPLYIPPSGYCVYPVVGLAAAPPTFVPHPDEVAEVIEVSLDHLLNSANTREEHWTIRGEPLQVPFYAYHHHKIWGATAMILAEFLEIAAKARGFRPPRP